MLTGRLENLGDRFCVVWNEPTEFEVYFEGHGNSLGRSDR